MEPAMSNESHPAPAAPQAEPIDLDAVAMQQMRQAAAESTWMPSEYSGSDWISDVCRWLRDGPPAAAPQAEPIADSDADYWLRNRQAILDAIERAGFVLMSNASGFWLHPRGTTDAQAEPKREPLSDERIDEIGEPFGYFQYGDAQGDKRRAFVRAIERAHGIGGSDAE